MRWHLDADGNEWTATVTPDGAVRLLRREVKPPYREGGDVTITYDTFEFPPASAESLSATLSAAAATGLA